MTTNSFTLPRADAAFIVDVILSAASKDDVTPVIAGGQLRVEGGKLTAVSTDRYRVHAATVDVINPSGDHMFNIPNAVAAWIKKYLNVFGRDQLHAQVIKITHDEGGVLTVIIADPMSDQTVTLTSKATPGNFPPVLKLIEKARAAETFDAPVRLRLDFLGKAAVLGSVYDPPTIKFTKTDNPNKPGVVYMAFHKDGKGGKYVAAEALVQPNLIL